MGQREEDRDLGRPAGAVALAAAALWASSGCTFFLSPTDPPPSPSFVVPFSCLPIGLDPLTGTVEALPETPPSAHVFFVARIERTTASLAPYYDRFMTEVTAGLSALGLRVTRGVLFPLDERPMPPVLAAWGCDLDDPQRLSPELVLFHYATQPPPPSEPLGCATDHLVRGGRSLPSLVTSYPAGLPGRSGRSVFGEAPDVVVLVHLDALARRAGLDDPICAEAPSLAQSRQGRASWLAYVGGSPATARVLHWFVHTDEEVDDVTLAARCRDLEGFPLELFDSLEASPRALYGPLARQIRSAGGRASTLSMCAMLVEQLRLEFLVNELLELGSELGVQLDRQLLVTLLEQGGPSPIRAPGGR